MTFDELKELPIGATVRTRPYDDIFADAEEYDGDTLFFKDCDGCFVVAGMKDHCDKEGTITEFWHDGKDSVKLRFKDGSKCDFWWAYPTIEILQSKPVPFENYSNLMK